MLLPYNNIWLHVSYRWCMLFIKIESKSRSFQYLLNLSLSADAAVRLLHVWFVNMGLNDGNAAVASCVGTGTGTGSPPEVSKVRSEATWSASSGFTAGHHCVSNSCPAALHWLPQGESYALGVRLDRRFFFHSFIFRGNFVEVFVLTCKVTHHLLRVEPENKLHRKENVSSEDWKTYRLWMAYWQDWFSWLSLCCLFLMLPFARWTWAL